MAQISRRSILGAGAAVVGGLVVGVDASPALASVSPKTKQLTRAHYARWVGKALIAERDGHSHRVTLTRIEHVSGATKKQADSCYNLIFTAKHRLPEGIYTVRRHGVPARKLFIGHLGTGTSMQALINRSH